jgi:hypothetical protein
MSWGKGFVHRGETLAFNLGEANCGVNHRDTEEVRRTPAGRLAGGWYSNFFFFTILSVKHLEKTPTVLVFYA